LDPENTAPHTAHELELLTMLQSWVDEDDVDEERGSFPEPWKPEAGETLIGIVRDRRSVDTDDGQRDVLELERPDGTRVSVWLSRAVLREEIDRANPKLGDGLGIKYLGEREGKSGRPYHLYRVRRLPGDSSAAWG
jgi:hypothetical protein